MMHECLLHIIHVRVQQHSNDQTNSHVLSGSLEYILIVSPPFNDQECTKAIAGREHEEDE